MNINKRIFSLLDEKGLNQTDLQNAINVAKAAVTAWKQERAKPNAEYLMKLAEYFDVTADYLLGRTDLKKPETYTEDELDLIAFYRRLSPNSKKIVMSLAELEYKHIEAFAQGEVPIKIIPQKQKDIIDKAKAANLKKNEKLPKYKRPKQPLVKVYNQAAAAGFGNYLGDNGDKDYEMMRVPCLPYGAEFGIRIDGDSMEPEIFDDDIVFVKRQPSIEIGEIGIFIYNGESFCKQLQYKDKGYYLHSLNKKYKDIEIFGDSIYCVGKVILS